MRKAALLSSLICRFRAAPLRQAIAAQTSRRRPAFRETRDTTIAVAGGRPDSAVAGELAGPGDTTLTRLINQLARANLRCPGGRGAGTRCAGSADGSEAATLFRR